ncbi:circumsporozoite-related antigen (CRA), putative [Hepatocystis sp. ex Piliocolobus tephrosceles]|nr:circumsporozoite-related antigen (CRA), putative [Hepatocystis sp. ex Piliocolobus tephrosceles]
MKNLSVFFPLFFLFCIDKVLRVNAACANLCNPCVQKPICPEIKKPTIDVHSLIKDLISKEEKRHQFNESNKKCKIIAIILGILATVATIAASIMAYKCLGNKGGGSNNSENSDGKNDDLPPIENPCGPSGVCL